MRLKLIILGEPIPKQSARFTKSGFAYQPKKLVIGKESIRTQIITQLPNGFKLIKEPLAILNLKFVFKPLRSFKNKQKDILNNGGEILKTTKPDLDNLEKMLYDALEGIVYINDSLITAKNNIKKVYGLTPRIEIEIQSK